MKQKTTNTNGYLQDYIVLDDGTTGTTDAQFIMNTISELCYKAGLSEAESKRYKKAVWSIIEKTDMNDIETFVEGNW